MKIYLIAGVLLLYSLALVFGTYGWMIRNESSEIFEHFEEQEEAVQEVREKIVYRDRIVTKKIEVIKNVQAPCLDNSIPTDADSELYSVYQIASQP